MPPIRHAPLFIYFPLVLLFFSSGCGPAQTSQSSAAPSTIVIEGGTLIDGTGAPALLGTRILIEDGRIQEIVQQGELNIPAGARVIRRGRQIHHPRPDRLSRSLRYALAAPTLPGQRSDHGS